MRNKDGMFRTGFALLLFLTLVVGRGTVWAAPADTLRTVSEDVLWGQFLEYMTSDLDAAEEEEWLLSMEEMEMLRTKKMNINSASVMDLMQIPLLDEAQVEQIHAYIYFHGPLQTLKELRMIPLLKNSTIRYLPLFVQCGNLPTSDSRTEPRSTKDGARMRGEAAYRMEIPFYYRKGYSVENGYVGNALRERLTFNGERKSAKGMWSMGLRTEKDPGERFGDAWGGYLEYQASSKSEDSRGLQNVGWKVVMGDFRAGYGEGLVLGMGAGVRPGSVYRRGGMGLRTMRGMDEISFLRGAGVSLFAGRHWELTALGSYRQVDGTLEEDGDVRTLLTTGLHRTASERIRKGNVDRVDGVLHAEWHTGNWKVGATELWQHFGKRLDPGSEVYRRWSMKGRDFLNTGVDYGWNRYRLSLSGETAYSSNHGGWGTTNRGEWTISRRLNVSVLQRWYSYRYTSGLGGSVCQGSTPTNESGVLLRVEAEPWRRWEWVSYLDVFRNPWARYGVMHSSNGQDGMVELTRQLGERSAVHRVGVRYQLKRKEASSGLVPSHRVRVQWEWEPEGQWSMRSAVQLHEAGNTGVSVSETVRWEGALGHRCGSLRVQSALAWFDTKDWACRLYQYEPSVSGSVTSMSLYGRGVRLAIVLRWQSDDGRWMVEGKYSLLKRWDVDSMGSGLEEIGSSRKGDGIVRVGLRL